MFSEAFSQNIFYSVVENEILISFLNVKDSKLPILNLEKTFFGLNIGELNSLEQGAPLDLLLIFQLADVLSQTIQEQAKINHKLSIKNKKFTCFFWTVSQFTESKNVKILYLWEFSAHMSQMSKEEWVDSNDLEAKNCCMRNFLLSMCEKSNSKLNLNYLENTNFCVFPRNFLCNFIHTY